MLYFYSFFYSDKKNAKKESEVNFRSKIGQINIPKALIKC